MSDRLIRGHAAFRQNYFNKKLNHRLATAGQKPTALYIGCSDSRVVPELLTNSGFGDIFVLRNVANFVPVESHTDASVGAAVEYAVKHLKVPDVVVCGHYGCGGVKAAVDGLKGIETEKELTEWLQGVVPAADQARARGLTGEALWRGAVEENVLDALDNLITFRVVRDALEQGGLTIHGWVYDMLDGHIMVFDAERDGFIDSRELLK
jgi:carbonic anhydrase